MRPSGHARKHRLGSRLAGEHDAGRENTLVLAVESTVHVCSVPMAVSADGTCIFPPLQTVFNQSSEKYGGAWACNKFPVRNGPLRVRLLLKAGNIGQANGLAVYGSCANWSCSPTKFIVI